jgi:hypothetical protein
VRPFQRHLQIDDFNAAELLAAVNQRRKVLGLAQILKLLSDTMLDAGVSAAAKAPEFNKQSALRDANALIEASKALPGLGKEQAGIVLAGIARLESDHFLLNSLQRRSLIEKGMALLDGRECPLCGHPWDDEQHLREHLKTNLMKSEEAARIQEEMLRAGAELGRYDLRLRSLLEPVIKAADLLRDVEGAVLFAGWRTELEGLQTRLADLEGLISLKAEFTSGWVGAPDALGERLTMLTKQIEAIPDQTVAFDAQTFLATAQTRLGDYREAQRRNKTAEAANGRAKLAYEAYCRAMEEELNELYDEVEADFSTLYRAINEDDEADFTAKLTPSAGRLDLSVNFYERGLFPPGAYHSEGHQDGMGVCLYLALMKRLFGERFTIALLDDVVMSVDSSHRYKFCKLLKTHFPNTQFIITTHDRLWAEQLKSAGLVTSKTSIAFHAWSVDTGPLVESNKEIWVEIEASLAKGKVEAADSALRHHLEYASRLLADQLRASLVFHSDGNYELGELLPSVLARMKNLLAKAANAAQSWGNTKAKDDVLMRRAILTNSNGAANVEQWAINKAAFRQRHSLGKTGLPFAPIPVGR